MSECKHAVACSEFGSAGILPAFLLLARRNRSRCEQIALKPRTLSFVTSDTVVGLGLGSKNRRQDAGATGADSDRERRS
jgi:hypothetical protein